MWQHALRFSKPVDADERVDTMRQWRHIGDALYPITHVEVDGLFAQSDLNSPVRLRLEQQIPLRVPLDAHRRILLHTLPFFLAH